MIFAASLNCEKQLTDAGDSSFLIACLGLGMGGGVTRYVGQELFHADILQPHLVRRQINATILADRQLFSASIPREWVMLHRACN